MDVQEIFMEVLKWIIIVFLAGFIGYFGRHLSKKVIEGFRSDTAKDQPAGEISELKQAPPKEEPTSGQVFYSEKTDEERLKDKKKQEKNRLKLEKKARKAQSKQDKA